MKHVLGIKLTTGDDLISIVVDADTAYTLTLPVVIAPMTDALGRHTVGLMDFLPASAEKIVAIDKRHVIFIYQPKEEVVETYNSLFGEGGKYSESTLPM